MTSSEYQRMWWIVSCLLGFAKKVFDKLDITFSKSIRLVVVMGATDMMSSHLFHGLFEFTCCEARASIRGNSARQSMLRKDSLLVACDMSSGQPV